METWRLLEIEYDEPYKNLTLEEALFKSLEKYPEIPIVRLWINPDSVIIGSSQEVRMEVNVERCMQKGIAIIRRFTGGGAVYHDTGNLNYSIFIPKSHRLFTMDIQKNFKLIADAVLKALRIFSFNPEFVPPNGVFLQGKKVSGLAGHLGKNTFAAHGTLLVESNLDNLNMVLNVPSSKNISLEKTKGVRSKKVEVTTLQRESGYSLYMNMVRDTLRNAFELTFGIRLEISALSDLEYELTEELLKDKYSTYAWNFQL